MCRALLLLCTFALTHVAVAQPQKKFYPAIAVQTYREANASSLREWMQEVNATMKSTHNVPLFIRGYQQLDSATNVGFFLWPSANFIGLFEQAKKYQSEPELQNHSEGLEVWRRDQVTYLKALRFDGTSSPGWLLNSLLEANTDEAVLAQAEYLASILDQEAIELKINVFKVVWGRAGYSHLLSLNLPSEVAAAKTLDRLATLKGGYFSNSKGQRCCDVVQQALYRELR